MSLTIPTITKKHYLAGQQCPKLVWHIVNEPASIPPADPQVEDRMQQGREVGALARQLFPHGIHITPLARHEALVQTQAALPLRQPTFEAAFQAEHYFTRPDILVPIDGGLWDVVEVKAGTSIEDAHLDDLAFQAEVLARAGMSIRSYSLLLVNNRYVREGAVDPNSLFAKYDVTQEVETRRAGMEGRLLRLLHTLKLSAPPAVSIGPHCARPFPCPLQEQCWRFLPQHAVTELYGAGAKAFGFLASDITEIRSIPADADLTDRQRIQRQTVLSGDLHVDVPAVQEFLARLEWPLHFLDFESFATAIPLIDGVRPYEQIIFQSSIHILSDVDGEPEHHSFLAEGRDDPRPELLRHLRDNIGERGSVVVYNQQFEEGRLRECAQVFPEHRAWIEQVIARMVDLLVPFREFSVYHPKQHGSCSIKAVLPALTGRGYSELAIQDGTGASREFLRITWTDCGEEERKRVRHDLLDYCGLDTGGMVTILLALRRIAPVSDTAEQG
jgi:hypothetical protein